MNILQRVSNSVSFQELIQVSFDIWTKRNPTYASGIGLTKYDNIWPDVSKSGIQYDIDILEAMVEKLQEFKVENLDSKEQEDYYLLNWFLDIIVFELKELKFWQYNPRLSGLILSGINQLVMRNHPTSSERLNAILARLEKVEELTKTYLSRLKTPVKLWVDAELGSLNGLLEYLTNLADFFPQAETSQKNRLNHLTNHAKEKLNQYKKDLESLETQNKLPTNDQLYSLLIEKRLIGYNIKELEELGHSYLQQTEIQLNELVKKLPGDSIKEVRKMIRQKHAPTFDKVVDDYKKLADKAKKLILEKDLLTMPQERLEVIFTPPPLRNFLSIAAAGPPGKFDPDQTGYFYCTPHEDKEMLQEHSYAYQPLLISHESYPGHHVHGTCKNQHPSLVRSTIFSSLSANSGLMYPSKLADMTEGWGLYCEKMMYAHGFENNPNDPDLEQKFLQINAMRWRAARMVIDTNLHTARMSYQDGVEFLIEHTGYNKTTAQSEVLMYSQSPGYFLSYLLGRHLIMELWDEVKDEMSQKKFHDKILYAGNVPFWFLKKHIFKID